MIEHISLDTSEIFGAAMALSVAVLYAIIVVAIEAWHMRKARGQK